MAPAQLEQNHSAVFILLSPFVSLRSWSEGAAKMGAGVKETLSTELKVYHSGLSTWDVHSCLSGQRDEYGARHPLTDHT